MATFKKLYPYQQKAVAALVPLLRKKRRVVAVSPTGSGKTVVGVATLLKMGKKIRVLWVAHRIELLEQARDKAHEIASLSGIPESDIGLLAGPDRVNIHARILVASVGSVVNRVDDLDTFDLIVVDEAHRTNANTYQRILGAWPGAMVLGLTATPKRLDGKALGDSFNALYEIATQSQLLREKRIAKIDTYGFPAEKLKKILAGVATDANDYSRKKLGERMGNNVLVGDVVKAYQKRGGGEAAICFAASREHAQKLVQRFKKAKLQVEYVDGDTDREEREDIIRSFKNDEFDILVNVDVLTEGFDCGAKCIIDACPTKSVTRYLQRVGRGVRRVGDKVCIYLDHAGNYDRHKPPQDDRAWTLDGKVKNGEVVSGEEVCRVCQHCGLKSMVSPGTKVCPECGEMYSEVKRKLSEMKHLELVRRNKKAEEEKARRVIYKKISVLKKYPASWVQRQMRRS